MALKTDWLGTAAAAAELTRGNSPLASNITYSFVDTGDYHTFTPAQVAGTKLALAMWSDVGNVTFTELKSGAKFSFLDYTDYTDAESASSQEFSNGTFQIGFNLANNTSTAFGPGSSGFDTLIHEVGHALGLEHPGNYNASLDDPKTTRDESDINYADHRGYMEDSAQYTVMSYFGASNTGASFRGTEISSPLLHDIAAMQRLYGANMTTRTGNTVYGFNSNAPGVTGDVYRIDSASEKVVFAIWDAGGTDTLDFSGYTQDQTIDLNPGEFSSVGGLRLNIAMADAVDVNGNNSWEAGFNRNRIANYIENAIGGSGIDRMYGNATANRLEGRDGDDNIDGGDGNDTLLGQADDDTLAGGRGQDVLEGGSGDDFLDGGLDGLADGARDVMRGGTGNDIYYVSDTADVVEDLIGGFDTADRIATTLNSFSLVRSTAVKGDVEILEFIGTGNFVGTGNALNNTISGFAWVDTLYGNAGNDTLLGGDGNDFLYGGANNDTLKGEGGDDHMDGGSGNDTYYVDAGDTVVELSGGGTDTIVTARNSYTLGANFEILVYDGAAGFAGSGNGLNNTIFGGSGWDTLFGHNGDDTLSGGAATDFLMGGAGNDKLYGDGDGDFLYGESGMDKLYGGHGNDTLDGGGHIDTLEGEDGDDMLIGGIGNDTLIGGRDSDTFAYIGAVADIGVDTIYGGTLTSDTGVDTLDFASLDGQVTVDLAARTFKATGGGVTVTSGKINGIEAVIGGSYADTLIGSIADEELNGGGGNDTLQGGGGLNFLTGGGGNDVFVFTNAWTSDIVTDFTKGSDILDMRQVSGLTSFSQLTVAVEVEGTTVRFGEKLIGLMGVGAGVISADDFWFAGQADPRLPIAGTESGDLLVGNGFANTIDAKGGNDTIDGRGGDDRLLGGAGNDRFLITGDLSDSGIDQIDGGADTDIIDALGFLGNVYIDLTSGVMGLAASNGLGYASTKANLIVGIENVSGSNQADTLTGNAGDNQLSGQGGDDVLSGGAGNDVLVGGAGTDTLSGGAGNDLFVADSLDVIAGGEGFDTIHADASTASAGYHFRAAGTEIEYIHGHVGNDVIDASGLATAITIAGSLGNDIIYGGGSNDILDGGAGNDVIIGGAGIDRAIGGDGDDILAVDNSDIIDGGSGHDIANADGSTVATGFKFKLAGTGIEYVNGNIGNDVIDATGVTTTITIVAGLGDDVVTGGSGDDLLIGDAYADPVGGNDIMYGGAGSDLMMGYGGNDTLYGGDGADRMGGYDGNDVLIGGAGGDTLDGGAGDDILVTDNFDVDIIQGGDGYDQVYASEFTIAGGFKFTMTAEMNVEGISGNNGNDVLDASVATQHVYLVGYDGDDVLTGGSGEDTMVGDAYDFSPAGNDVMYGGLGSDHMYGYNGDDIMYGGGSNLAAGFGDRLWGGAGNDTLYGGGDGWVLGEAGNDTLTGAAGDLVMGGAGNDTVLGAAGFQQIIGGEGDDRLSGGAGGDRFDFANGWGRDVITDFNAAEGDKIGMFDVTGLDTFSQLAIVNSGDGADVSFGADSIHLSGITAAQVQSDWFIL